MDSILPEAWYKGLALSETEQDKILYDEAMVYVKENPSALRKAFSEKALLFHMVPARQSSFKGGQAL